MGDGYLDLACFRRLYRIQSDLHPVCVLLLLLLQEEKRRQDYHQEETALTQRQAI